MTGYASTSAQLLLGKSTPSYFSYHYARLTTVARAPEGRVCICVTFDLTSALLLPSRLQGCYLSRHQLVSMSDKAAVMFELESETYFHNPPVPNRRVSDKKFVSVTDQQQRMSLSKFVLF